MEHGLSSRILNASRYLTVREATKPSRVYTTALVSSGVQTMPARHVQSQQISSLRDPLRSQLSVRDAQGWFINTPCSACLSERSCWLAMGLGELFWLYIYD